MDQKRRRRSKYCKGVEAAEKVRRDEAAWISAGSDAGAEFQKKYLQAGR